MKYDDDEVAEAALLLAYHQAEESKEPAPSMPAHLERRILDRGRAIAADVRYTTTAAGALTVADESIRVATPARSSPFRQWVGWLAAAACFAIAVYGWRTATLERTTSHAAPRPSALALPRAHLQALGLDGKLVADLRVGREPNLGELTILSLPPTAAGEHYRVWLSSGDAASALPVGSFMCIDPCGQRVFSVSTTSSERRSGGSSAPLERIDSSQNIWLTRNRASDPWSLDNLAAVVAEGHGGAR